MVIYGNGGKIFRIGDVVWILVYFGTATPKRYHGEIVTLVPSDARATGNVEIITKRSKHYRAPANCVYDHMPKATTIEDALGTLTIWE